MKTELIFVKQDEAVCDSLQVAEKFGKRHADVIRSIENMIEIDSTQNCVQCFRESLYTDDTGKKNKMYVMNRDGFSILGMGFTGKNAMEWKWKYIHAFNEMERCIVAIREARLEFPAFTKAIQEAHENPMFYHYTNEIDMINRIVLGMTASKYKAVNGIPRKVQSIRPYLDHGQIESIETLQRIDIGLIAVGMNCEEKKEVLSNYHYRKMLESKENSLIK